MTGTDQQLLLGWADRHNGTYRVGLIPKCSYSPPTYADRIVSRTARSDRLTGKPERAGINRQVVGDERALQERRQRIYPGLESCK
jgi:hypothetical protein